MERFDPEKYQITHSQLVPTMFSRMLKLPRKTRQRFDLSSLEFAVHAGAPCPIQVKEQMIDWWGPIIHEFYGATEGHGFTACDSAEWLAHPGTVWFKTATEFEYFNDAERTAEAKSADGSMSTVGDVGYIDNDNLLYLTDRATFMIVLGGVNIYPQECENLLIVHPKVADAAVFGVPNEDLGEEVEAVIQLMPGYTPDDLLAEELMVYCRELLSRQKCPRSIDFEDELPRLPTGKLYKSLLRDRYWGDQKSRIV